MRLINVLVTCTKQKTQEPHQQLCLGSVLAGSISERAARWIDRVENFAGEPISPQELYSGDHWAVSRGLAQSARSGLTVQVWVISAGYGLLSLDAPILPYSATFSSRHPDCVVLADSVDDPARSQKRDWWNALSCGPWHRERPWSIAHLAAEYPDCPMLIAASANYLGAIQDDVRAALERLDSPGLLSIISAGSSPIDGLAENQLPVDARLQPVVGGVLRSINVRLLRHLIQDQATGSMKNSALAKVCVRLLANAPQRTRVEREPISDSELRSFVTAAIRERSVVSQTRLLRELRDQGRACEQTRFRNLFREVQEGVHG